MSGVLRGNCCETCHNIPQKIPTKKFTKKNSLTRQMQFLEQLQQLLINKKIFDKIAVGSGFVWLRFEWLPLAINLFLLSRQYRKN